MERDGKDPANAGRGSGAAKRNTLARDMDSEQAASMARGCGLPLRRQRTGSVVGELPGISCV